MMVGVRLFLRCGLGIFSPIKNAWKEKAYGFSNQKDTLSDSGDAYWLAY